MLAHDGVSRAGGGERDKSKALGSAGRGDEVWALIMAKRPSTSELPRVAVDDVRRVGAWPLVIAAVTLVAYHNSFSGPLFFDDTASIVQNESIRSLWPLGPVLSPPAVAGTAGRPLLNLSFALNYAAGGLGVVGYHWVNLAIHVGAALVLFGLVRRTLRLPQLRDKFGAVATELGALSALLWAVHPLQTESVTYVSQRAESLVGFFYFLTWYAFVHGVEAGRESSATGLRWRALAIVAGFAGVLTKEIIITAPVVILLYDSVFVAGTFREAWARRRTFYLGLASAWVLLAVLMISSRLHERGVGFGGKIAWIDYVATSCEAVALYLKLSIWPHPLLLDYGMTPARGGAVLLASATVVVAFLAATAWAWRHWRALGFAGAAVVIMLSPTSSVVPVVFQPIAEHRMYLPLAVVVSFGVVGAFARWGRGAWWAALAVVAVFLGLTTQRNRDYRNDEVMWRDVIAKRPDNWRAYNALANVLFTQQRVADGLAQVETAVRLKPDEAKLLNNYANALALPMVGRLAEAVAVGRRAVALDPDYADARNSLAQTLLKTGRVVEAVEQYEAARRLQPASAAIRSNLCDALRQAGRLGDAVVEGQEALRLRPEFAEAESNLGLALADAGRSVEAIAHYQAALRLRPTYLEVRNNLGVALLNLGRLEEARTELTEALRLKPDYAEAHNSLGIVFAKLGRTTEAGGEFETALRLKPDYVNARENLRILRAMQDSPAAPRE
jgi:Flp pilus assembly protein TadD